MTVSGIDILTSPKDWIKKTIHVSFEVLIPFSFQSMLKTLPIKKKKKKSGEEMPVQDEMISLKVFFKVKISFILSTLPKCYRITVDVVLKT